MTFIAPLLMLIHILAATFWIGSMLFMLLIVEPAMLQQEPLFRIKLLDSLLMRKMPAAFAACSMLIFVSGILYTFATMSVAMVYHSLFTISGVLIITGALAGVTMVHIALAYLQPTCFKILAFKNYTSDQLKEENITKSLDFCFAKFRKYSLIQSSFGLLAVIVMILASH